MNDTANDILSQLRDIHTVTEPGWWPPAPGWWVLATLLLVLLFLLMRAGIRRWRVRQRKAKYMQALEQIQHSLNPAEQAHEYLAQLNRLFRAVALRAFPGTASTRLQGQAWVDFLRSMLPEASHGDSLDSLASGPYQPIPEFDAGSLDALAREWVKRYG